MICRLSVLEGIPEPNETLFGRERKAVERAKKRALRGDES